MLGANYNKENAPSCVQLNKGNEGKFPVKAMKEFEQEYNHNQSNLSDSTERKHAKRKSCRNPLSPVDENIRKRRPSMDLRDDMNIITENKRTATPAIRKGRTAKPAQMTAPMAAPMLPPQVKKVVKEKEHSSHESNQTRRDSNMKKMNSIHQRLFQMKESSIRNRSTTTIKSTSTSNIGSNIRSNASSARFLAVQNCVKKGDYAGAAEKILALEAQIGQADDSIFKNAQFWIVKANILEKLGLIKEALEAYNVGIENNAKPSSKILKRMERFVQQHSLVIQSQGFNRINLKEQQQQKQSQKAAPSTPVRSSRMVMLEEDDDSDDEINSRPQVYLTPAKALCKIMNTPNFNRCKTPMSKALSKVVLDDENSVRSPVEMQRRFVRQAKTPIASKLKATLDTPPRNTWGSDNEEGDNAPETPRTPTSPNQIEQGPFLRMMDAFTPRKIDNNNNISRRDPITPYSSALNRMMDAEDDKQLLLSRTPAPKSKSTAKMKQSLQHTLQSCEKNMKFKEQLLKSADKRLFLRSNSKKKTVEVEEPSVPVEEDVQEQQESEIEEEVAVHELCFGEENMEQADDLDMDLDLELDHEMEYQDEGDDEVDLEDEEDDDVISNNETEEEDLLEITQNEFNKLTLSARKSSDYEVMQNKDTSSTSVVVLSQLNQNNKKKPSSGIIFSPVKRSTRITPLKKLQARSKKFMSMLATSKYAFEPNPALPSDVKIEQASSMNNNFEFAIPAPVIKNNSKPFEFAVPAPIVKNSLTSNKNNKLKEFALPQTKQNNKPFEFAIPAPIVKQQQQPTTNTTNNTNMDSDGFAIPALPAGLKRIMGKPQRTQSKQDTPRPVARRQSRTQTPVRSVLQSPAGRRRAKPAATPPRMVQGLATVTPVIKRVTRSQAYM